MNKNIILCGVGGQGTVLASRLISSAAMARSIPVLSAETIGCQAAVHGKTEVTPAVGGLDGVLVFASLLEVAGIGC